MSQIPVGMSTDSVDKQKTNSFLACPTQKLHNTEITCELVVPKVFLHILHCNKEAVAEHFPHRFTETTMVHSNIHKYMFQLGTYVLPA